MSTRSSLENGSWFTSDVFTRSIWGRQPQGTTTAGTSTGTVAGVPRDKLRRWCAALVHVTALDVTALVLAYFAHQRGRNEKGFAIGAVIGLIISFVLSTIFASCYCLDCRSGEGQEHEQDPERVKTWVTCFTLLFIVFRVATTAAGAYTFIYAQRYANSNHRQEKNYLTIGLVTCILHALVGFFYMVGIDSHNWCAS